ILFYGVGAVCLLKLKQYNRGAQYQHFEVLKIFVYLYLYCTVFIAVAPFFPIPSSKYESLNYKSFVPFVASWIPILISVSICSRGPSEAHSQVLTCNIMNVQLKLGVEINKKITKILQESFTKTLKV
ncbi:14236_t:CDS:2, partial [Cetraspora pellucida]